MLWTIFLCAVLVFQFTTPSITTAPVPLHLSIQAVPDFPVSEGQVVVLQCVVQGGKVEGVIYWTWAHNVQVNWTKKYSGTELRLSRPEQTGFYRCHAKKSSSDHAYVMIVSLQKTAVDDLGLAGFALSVLALILVLVLVFWLVWQTFSTTPTTPNISTGLPNTPKVPEMAPPVDSDVYMNYSCSNQGYTDLDPTTTCDDGVYSSFP